MITLEEMTRRALVDYDASLNTIDAERMAEYREDCGRWLDSIRKHPELKRKSWTVWIAKTTGIPRIEAKACLGAFNSLMWTQPSTTRGKARRLAYLMALSEAGGRAPEGQALRGILQEIQSEAQERYNAQTE